jgi:hypothetical protein
LGNEYYNFHGDLGRYPLSQDITYKAFKVINAEGGEGKSEESLGEDIEEENSMRVKSEAGEQMLGVKIQRNWASIKGKSILGENARTVSNQIRLKKTLKSRNILSETSILSRIQELKAPKLLTSFSQNL